MEISRSLRSAMERVKVEGGLVWEDLIHCGS